MRAFRSRGLAVKLIFLILTSVTLIFSAISIYNYFISRRIIVRNLESNARNLTLATVNRIDTVLQAVEKVPRNLAYFLESSGCTGSELFNLLRSIVENNPEIYGATIAFEPYAYSRRHLSFAPYYYKNQGKIEFTYIPYNYFSWDWYQISKELNSPVWSEPYYDEGAGNIIMATFSVPFYERVFEERRLKGVVTADISLSWLQKIVSSIKIARTGYGFLISKNGTYVTHPREDLVMNETVFSVAEARGDPRLRELGRAMIRGGSDFVPMEGMTPGQAWMAYAPLPSNGWSLGVLFPQEELMEDLIRLNHTVLFLGLVGFFFVLVVIVWIAGSITSPLRILSRATGEIATGNLDVELPPIRSRDEVGKLAESFDSMRSSLKDYIRKLTETTAAKERIESELKIARDIQMGILPKTFPPFPDRAEFDIYATIEPAREVGGDLYDFFFLDEDHLCFSVGDVSGKGVPASLFMAVTNTLIKTKAVKGLTPAAVLNRVNDDLSMDNPSVMFVTLFLGILNVRTGEVHYSNGGHNAPFLIDLEGGVSPLETTNGMALGVVEGFSYESKKMVLKRGETIFLYTDGVTEAMNRVEEMFSEARLRGELAHMKQRPVEEMIYGIMEKIRAFSQGVAQTDDITMMAIRFHGQ